MLSIKINILYIVLITTIVGIQSLLELSTEEENSIKIAETVIRNTVNKLFILLKIQESKQQHRLKQFLAIYDFFVSITLTDCDNLKKVVRLSRVNDIDNIQHLIAQINEILNKSDNSSETNGSDIFVAKHIERFIGKLKYLKEKHDTNKNNIIDATILSYLNDNGRNLNNITGYNNSKKIKVAKEDRIGNETISNFTGYWKPSGRRIYKGFRTRIKNFPFMASVQFFKKFQCAGSIIKDDLVITSASCLQLSWNNRFFRENPAFLSVQIGSDFYEHGGENIAVQEIYFHPGYDPKTLRHNLALMRLSRRIAFKRNQKRVRKIDIDREPFPLSGYDYITVLGWGARDSSNIVYNVLQNRLSYANLDFYPLDECREHYTKKFVSRQNFCAGFFSKGAGACNRDSGGPALIGYTLMGVISFGSPICGSPDSPTVFTKLGYYADWIDEIMDQDVPSVYKRTTIPLPAMIYTLEEKSTTKELRLTPVGPIRPVVPTYVDDLRIAQEESFNDFSSSQEILDLFENYNSEINKSKYQARDILSKQKEVTIKMVQIRPEMKTTPAVENKLRQQQLNGVENNDDSMRMSKESVSNSTTQAAIKITKPLYNEDKSMYKSIETDSESVNDPPMEVINDRQQEFKEDDSDYDSTETDTESIKKSPTEPTFKLPHKQINNNENNNYLNKIGTIVHSTKSHLEKKIMLQKFYEVKNDDAKNEIKRQTLNKNKKQKIRNLNAQVKQNVKTATSAITIGSLNKAAQINNTLNRQQSNEYGSNDESIETDTESTNNHSTEVEKNVLMQQQFNVRVSDDVIKRYIKQILNTTNNKKKESIQNTLVTSETTSTAPYIVLPNNPTKQALNKLRQLQFDDDGNTDESVETATESTVNNYPTELKNKITQQKFNVGVSDYVIKKYIMQYLKEKGSIKKDQVKLKTTTIISTNRPTPNVRNEMRYKPFNEENEELIETDIESVNEELTHQKPNVGGPHAVLKIEIPQNKEKGTIKKVQVKPKLKKTSTTTTTIVTLNKSTAHVKNKLRQPQFETDRESHNDKLKPQRFNVDGRHSQLIDTDRVSVKELITLDKGVNVRDIKDDIMTLIDNLDIDQLLDHSDYSKKKDVRTGQLNNTKKDTINLKQWTSLKYLFSSDEDRTGLSIPAESFNNLSVSNLPESIEYNKIPKSILFDLVSLAVEEEIKRKADASKAIRNGRHYLI